MEMMNEEDKAIIRNNAVVALIHLKNATREISEAKDRLIGIMETLEGKGKTP